MHCEKRNRKWACKSRIGAYIRGEIKLEDIMHPSKIIKPKERHNRRWRAFDDADACRTFLPSHERVIVHKDIESKIRPYIQGLKSLKELVHPSKLTSRVIGSHTFLELLQGGGLCNAIMYDGGDSKLMDELRRSPSATQPANLQSLFAMLENGGSDAVIRVDNQRRQRYVTVVVSDQPYAEEQVLSLIAKMQNSEQSELPMEASQKLGIGVPSSFLYPRVDSSAKYSARVASPVQYSVQVDSPVEYSIRVDSPAKYSVRVESPVAKYRVLVNSPTSEANSDHPPSPDLPQPTADPSSNELITRLYQKIQTLLEQRIETFAYNQHQFEKLESLQKENFHLRSTIAKISEKLNDIEDCADTFSVKRVGGDREPLSYQEKLRVQNERLLKTIDTMNSYLVNFERAEAEARRKNAAEVDGDRYKILYEKEVKNFKRHKRKCEVQHRQLLQRCNQLHQRLQELDNQNLEMAAKLSYVPVKIQLACRQYQDIIKKLNEDLNSLRNLERKSKPSTFVYEKSYPKHFTWF